MSHLTFKSTLTPLPPRAAYLQEAVHRVTSNDIVLIEQWIALAIRPPPRFVPKRFWYWMVGKCFLRIQGSRIQ